MLDILVIAPHPDDAELGMGGAIVKFLAEGLRVGVLDLTSGEPTPHGSLEIRAQETAAATEILGLRLARKSGTSQSCLEPTLDTRAKLAEVFRRTTPRGCSRPTGSMPIPTTSPRRSSSRRPGSGPSSPRATWPASRIIRSESSTTSACTSSCIRSPPSCSISPASGKPSSPAIRAYESQFITGRPTAPPTFLDQLRDEAAYWGKSIGRPYGEPFASREPLGLSTLAGLI